MNGRPVLVGAGILRPEVMLRQAQTEIEQLREVAGALQAKVVELEVAVDTATRCFAAVTVRLGGSVTITTDELEATYRFGLRRTDPATHARTFEAQRVPALVPDPPADAGPEQVAG